MAQTSDIYGNTRLAPGDMERLAARVVTSGDRSSIGGVDAAHRCG